MKPITDKAEISIDFPDKAYMGAFGRHSSFDVRADAESLMLKLEHAGDERRTVEIHLHYYLLADVLASAAEAIARLGHLDNEHRGPLKDAAQSLAKALRSLPAK